LKFHDAVMTTAPARPSPVALITGASQGLGLALARALAAAGWRLVIDARHADALHAVARELGPSRVAAIAGDVGEPGHRAQLAMAVGEAGRLDLLVHNASELGPSPLPALVDYPLDEYEHVYRTNVVAPLALTQLLLQPLRATHGALVAVSSDAAVEAYPGWGGYGSAKAALDQLVAVLAAENPDLRVYGVDPGDMNTAMQQRAFPGEDISDRPSPDTVVPALLRLARQELPSGRYQAADLLAAEVGA
jgi:NAD(P)-dependent dehydrogenase (short-subunit alcohol dehydrogenase family)